ncbi:ATP-dependent DNA helicase Q1 [Nymphon striatum]|nr:ATP-dependent DNA helicase Q1 [Nymphon striatum]
MELQLELRKIQSELSEVDEQIQALIDRKQELNVKKKKLKKLLEQNVVTKSDVTKSVIDFSKTDFPWSDNMIEKMKTTFKISLYRPYQLEAMNATMSGNDCILIMPTGGGKSLCYQLPALISDGVTVVVSPLISLMEDQIHGMESIGLGHTCSFFSATKKASEATAIFKAMIDPKSSLKILFVTPEKVAKSKRFMAKLEKMYSIGRFDRLAIDEIHCISQWGHDFRPDYKILGIMKKQFPNVPILGLTATLTSKVSADVKTLLGIQGCVQFKASFNRSNLMYEVHSKSSTQSEILKTVAADLKRKNICAASYHAQLDPVYRSKVHSDWLKGKTKVVVATIAFGMGINKPNVRFVIHHSLSKSMENFYQESGRAGRDGIRSDCIVFYRLSDLFRLSTMVFKDHTGLENLYAMAAYCVSHHKCRRVMIAESFGEIWDKSQCQKMCDSCRKNRDSALCSEVDLTEYCLGIYAVILNAKEQDHQKLTALKIVDCLLRKKGNFVTKFNQLSRETNENLIALLLLESYLQEDFHFTAYAVISYLKPGIKSATVLNGKHKVKLFIPSRLREIILKCCNNKPISKVSSKTSKDLPNVKKPIQKPFKSIKTNHHEVCASQSKGVVYEINDSDDNDDLMIVEHRPKKIKMSEWSEF